MRHLVEQLEQFFITEGWHISGQSNGNDRSRSMATMPSGYGEGPITVDLMKLAEYLWEARP
jgi:hypothetical protein